MKKYTKIILSVFTASALLLSACSMPSDNAAQEATQAPEYLSDKNESTESDTSTAEASAESSIVVVDEFFEPTLDNSSSGTESTTDASSEASTVTSEDEQKDKVEIVFFGDSQIANARDDGTDLPSLVSKRVPDSKVYNLAIGGTTVSVPATTSTYAPGELKSTCFLGMVYCLAGKSDRNETLSSTPEVLSTMNSIDPSKVDFYVIEYGANDFFTHAPLDNTSDSGADVHSVFISLDKGIEVLKEISPNATFVIMTPFYGIYVDQNGGYIGDSYIVSNGIGTLADYARKIGNVAENTSNTYLFDTMFMSKCDLYLDTAGEYLMDNLHLTLKGRQIFARLLAHLFNFLLGNEPYAYLEGDFINIAEFDPDETYRMDEHLMETTYPESWEKYIRGEFPLAQPSEEAVERYKAQNG